MVHVAKEIKEICLEAGADDVGLVELERETLQNEREGILRVYANTRSIISFLVAYNPENIQSPARYVANAEYHHVRDKTSTVAREIVRKLNRLGIRGVVVNSEWPMAVNRIPAKIWDVSHKIMAVEAGLGHMGLNRLVLHPQYGSCVMLDSILVDGAFDEYDRPLAESPCIDCNLCVAVCSTGAISKGQPFDPLSCLVHNYRDNFIGFGNWVEAMVTARDMAEYRADFDDRETASMWQSLMFGMSYRCSYCMAVCPAGEGFAANYRSNKKDYVDRIVKPLREIKEPVYVMTGSKAEAKVKSNPSKEIRIVPGVVRKPSA